VNLWDIVNRFQAIEVCVQMGNFAITEAQLVHGDYATEFYGRDQIVIDLLSHIIHVSKALEAAGLENDVRLFNAMQGRIAEGHLDDSALASEARNAKAILLEALRKLQFLYVAPDRLAYLDQRELFGRAVNDAFPSAVVDVRESGNCLAAECPTAAVFHLMRAVEYALRALAQDRQVTLPKSAVLDLATWEDIIKQLEGAELAIQGYPRTSAREKQFKFYHGAMMEFKRFKNVFRNSVMHTRDDYDRDAAHGVFVHVRDFMKILATEISETKVTPMIWV
jgi:hypothetical protein